MATIFQKLFCKHKWKSHSKKEMRVEYFNRYNQPRGERDFTKEVLICENCGKVKTIEY